MSKTIQIVVALGVIAAVLFFVLSPEEASQGPMGGRPPVPVIVHEVGYAEFVERIEAIGTLKANESVTLTARVRETVTRVNLKTARLSKRATFYSNSPAKKRAPCWQKLGPTSPRQKNS